VKTVMQNPVKGIKRKDYRVSAQGGLMVNEERVDTTLSVAPLAPADAASEIFIVTLDKPLM